MELPSELFNRQSILTLTGAAGAIYVVTAAAQHALNFNPRWLALGLSIAAGIVGASTIEASTYVDYLIGVVNGCLIYCTAVGINTLAGGPSTGRLVSKGMGQVDSGAEKCHFRSRWF